MENLLLLLTIIIYFVKSEKINQSIIIASYAVVAIYFFGFKIDQIMIVYLMMMGILYLINFSAVLDKNHLIIINLFLYFSLSIVIYESLNIKLLFLILAFFTFIRLLLFDINFKTIMNFVVYNILGIVLIFIGLLTNEFLLIFSTIGLGISALLFPLNFWYIKFVNKINFDKLIFLNTFYLFIFTYCFIKVYQIYHFERFNHIILYLGIIGMVISSLFALYQNNLNDLLPYSTMAQMSFVFFIIGFNTKFAYMIAYYQLIVHSLSNFFIYIASNKNLDTIIDQLSFTKKNLLTVTICIFSIIGIPFFPGFIVKWTIGIRTLVNKNIYLFATMMFVSIIWIVSFMPILVNSYINNSRKEDVSINKKFVLIVGNITIIILGIFSRYLLM